MSANQRITTIHEAVADAWSTLFMKKVSITSSDLSDGSSFDASSFTGNHIHATVSFSGDISGSTDYYFNEKQALTMVGMMMSMGADDAMIDSTREGSLGDEEIDALKEGFNQLGATAATILRDDLGCSVSSSVDAVQVIELNGETPNCAFGASHQCELEGYENDSFLQTLDDVLYGALNKTEEAAPVDTAPQAVQGIDLQQIKGLKVAADVVLAERNMKLQEVLDLSKSSIIEFWKPCDHPAEMVINNTVLANGEVVTMDQHFGIRIIEVAPKRLGTYQKN